MGLENFIQRVKRLYHVSSSPLDNILNCLVDLKDISFMDSSGLGALVLAFKTLRAADTKLVLCSINEQVKILFELTGMDKVFEIFSNQDEFNQAVLSQIA
ncbi:MAG: STAS domain-containing protein [Rivularia sp. (in: cyanobacteria)]